MPFWSWTGTATQSNAAGGGVVIDMTAGIGNVVRVLNARAVGTFGLADNLLFSLFDEDNVEIVRVVDGAAASGTNSTSFPRANTNVDSTTNIINSAALDPVEVAGPDLKWTAWTSAIAQNDTVQDR